jgi:sodium-dependent dicarboxylate transporter 2/3/5
MSLCFTLNRLLFGVMFTSWFLSFWLPNIATVAMMVPIVDAVIRELTIAARSKMRVLSSPVLNEKASMLPKVSFVNFRGCIQCHS